MADGPPVQILRSDDFLADCRSLGVPEHAISGIVRAVMFTFERDPSLQSRQWGSLLIATLTRGDGPRIQRPRVAWVRLGDDVRLDGISES